jgi:FKBP-type peptidyl-prolyl cis-trans isomerase (trigger factor)
MTDDELNTSIIIDLQLNEVPVKKDGEKVLPEIDDETALKYFGTNAEEYKKNLKDKTENERKWEYIYNYLLENTIFSYMPESAGAYFQKVISACKKKAAAENQSIDAYLETNYGASYTEFHDQIYGLYSEMLIFYALAQKEQLTYSENDYNDKIKELSDKGTVFEEELDMLGKEYGYYKIIYSDMEKILTDKIPLNK